MDTRGALVFFALMTAIVDRNDMPDAEKKIAVWQAATKYGALDTLRVFLTLFDKEGVPGDVRCYEPWRPLNLAYLRGMEANPN